MEDDYQCDCDICDIGKCYNDMRICDECLRSQEAEKADINKALELFDFLGLKVFVGRGTDRLYDYSVPMMDLYEIICDQKKLKEFVFKIKNKAFV